MILSFHSISFPNEWERPLLNIQKSQCLVSIQLVFPTSGKDEKLSTSHAQRNCFHSISFPNEWERLRGILPCLQQRCFHSISFPNEWERNPQTEYSEYVYSRFHSISFPNEWERHLNLMITLTN